MEAGARCPLVSVQVWRVDAGARPGWGHRRGEKGMRAIEEKESEVGRKRILGISLTGDEGLFD